MDNFIQIIVFLLTKPRGLVPLSTEMRELKVYLHIQKDKIVEHSGSCSQMLDIALQIPC